MKCNKCGEKEATFFYSETVNGVSHAQHLCATCAEAEGLLSQKPTGAFQTFFDSAFPTLFGTTATKKSSATCGGCGATFSEILKAGKVSCPRCYESFEAELSSTLRSIHGNVTHTGRRPQKLSESLAREEKKAALRQELATAIAEENFEKAATLRDEIRALGDA